MSALKSAEKTKKPFFGIVGMDKKKLEYLIAIIIIAVLILLYFSTFSGKQNGNQDNSGNHTNLQQKYSFDVNDEENKLKAILSSIKGAGDIEVMITYEGSAEQIPAYDTNTKSNTSTQQGDKSTSTTTSNDETKKPASNNSGTVVVSEKRPNVLGVIVVAEGAGNIKVKVELAQAVQTVLNVPASKVCVLEMKNKGE
jgi:stage III sporulation protein AG